MPRYRYRCSECEELSTIFHGMFEEPESCPSCEADGHFLIKLIGKINLINTSPRSSSSETRVKEFIKDSKEVLEQQKREARDEHD